MNDSRKGLRNAIVDGPASIGERMRARRWDWFRTEFPDLESMSVIDLGGTADAWLRAPVRPASVHVVNLEPEPSEPPASWIRADTADACELPGHITAGSYDLVFSNSVLEHVGGHAQRLRFADSVHKLASLHWVQTPYRYFPLEFLPVAARAEVSRRWPLAHTKAPTLREGMEAVLWVELVSRSEMAYLFRDSTIRAEHMLGLPKSLIAIKKS
jgi:hypothetical protein